MGLTGASGAMRVWGDIIAHSHSRPLEQLAPEGVGIRSGEAAGSGPAAALAVPYTRQRLAPQQDGEALTERIPAPRPARKAAPEIFDMFDRLSE